MRTFTPRQLSVSAVALLLLLLFPLFPWGSSQPMHVMIMLLMFGMMGVAWNIMGGYAGMFSFGQAAFFGIGAYTSSYLVTAHQVSPWIGLFAGGVLAALTAAAIGIPCSNLRGHYFAIASIAFAEIIRIHFNNWKMIGAAEGLTLPMLPESFANFMFHSSKAPYYYIYPQVGGLFGTISFCIVAFGGFGSIEGAFIAGILIGFVQTLGGYFFDPAYKYAIVFMVYLITVWIRPKGLLGW